MFQFLGVIFNKIQIYATCIVVVMEAGVEYMCSNTYALESQGKYIHKHTLIMNEIHYICWT